MIDESTGVPVVALLMPPPRRDKVFAGETLRRLERFAQVIVLEGDTAELGRKLPEILPLVDACLTGWGAPVLPPALLARSPRLRIIAHAAGSVKGIVPIEALEQGIVVCHAADIIAQAVAECTVLLILTGLRPLHLFDRALKDGHPWQEAADLFVGRRLAGCTVGLLGCGKVARRLIGLLQPFDVAILVFDPYLAPEEAARLGVRGAALADVLRESDIVSNHLPTTAETQQLIGAAEFALLRDGALFVHTARAWTIDEAALLGELERGRLWAALDVFTSEPLPRQSAFRRLPNVFLTPHKAGETGETYRQQGTAMVDELERFFRNQALCYRLLPETYRILA
jgi:phosphoglycerate dehydrogenase-like enzyme